MSNRAKKGTITIDSYRGMLRLRLPRSWFNGKLKFFSLGLSDTPQNQIVALTKSSQMQLDYISGCFDFSLEKYKLATLPEGKINLIELFEKFTEYKIKILKQSSHHNFKATLNKLKDVPQNIVSEPSKLRLWMSEHNTQKQARRYMARIVSCYNWAIESGLVESGNPYAKLKKFKKEKPAEADPFNEIEKNLIISAFENNNNYFANFIKFLFLTGCRPSEACGLKWKNIDLLIKHRIKFCEVVVSGVWQEGTKTEPYRFFPVNQQLRELLANIQRPDEYVFHSKKGFAIDNHNFLNREWKPLVKELPIRYRSIYSVRDTFITNCLEKGIKPKQLSKWVGNSPEIIWKNYAGIVEQKEVPNF